MEPIDALYRALQTRRGIICRSPTPELLYGKLHTLRKSFEEFSKLTLKRRGDLIFIEKEPDDAEED